MLGRCLLIPKYFCAVYDYAGKAVLGKGYGKKKIGGNHACFGDNLATIILKSSKIRSNVWPFFFQSKLELCYL